jgi:hypothetical protein
MLPKYYIVKNDGSDLFKEYIKELNKDFNENWEGTTFDYYGYDGNENRNGTNGFDEIDHFINNPTILTPKQYFDMKKEFNPQRGDLVLVSDDNEDWQEAIFLTELKGAIDPYITVDNYYITEFENNKKFDYCPWAYIKPLEEVKLTELNISEIEEKLNIPKGTLRIKD